jgi:hypothetical protein
MNVGDWQGLTPVLGILCVRERSGLTGMQNLPGSREIFPGFFLREISERILPVIFSEWKRSWRKNFICNPSGQSHVPWRCNPLRFWGGGACGRMRVRKDRRKEGWSPTGADKFPVFFYRSEKRSITVNFSEPSARRIHTVYHAIFIRRLLWLI